MSQDLASLPDSELAALEVLCKGENSAALIVAAVNALPGLIRTVRAQRAEIHKLSDHGQMQTRVDHEQRNEIARLRAYAGVARKKVAEIIEDADCLLVDAMRVRLRNVLDILAALDGKEQR